MWAQTLIGKFSIVVVKLGSGVISGTLLLTQDIPLTVSEISIIPSCLN